jgi:hypothetical protein
LWLELRSALAEKRMIAKRLINSERLMDCSNDTVRLLFVWLCLSVDDDGKMQGRARTIKKMFFGDRDDIKVADCEDMLKELAGVGLIIYYREIPDDEPKLDYGTYIEIPKWTCINKVRKDMYKPSEIDSYDRDLHDLIYPCNVDVTDPLHRLDKVRLDKVSKSNFQELEIVPDPEAGLTKEEKAQNFVLPSKKEILNFSIPKITECIDILAYKLYKQKIFEGIYAFKGMHLKRDKNERAILHTLIAIFTAKKKPDNPWKYCQAIMVKEDQTYNERDNTRNSQ